MRGCWRGRRFLLLHEALTAQQVKDHLLDAWHPTRYERWWGDAQKADTRTVEADENTNVALPSVGAVSARMSMKLQLTAGRPPTSCATGGPTTRAVGAARTARST